MLYLQVFGDNLPIHNNNTLIAAWEIIKAYEKEQSQFSHTRSNSNQELIQEIYSLANEKDMEKLYEEIQIIVNARCSTLEKPALQIKVPSGKSYQYNCDFFSEDNAEIYNEINFLLTSKLNKLKIEAPKNSAPHSITTNNNNENFPDLIEFPEEQETYTSQANL